jgi:pyruvate formate-lyase/glycerol dehydratase family glycyl radical enzyme
VIQKCTRIEKLKRAILESVPTVGVERGLIVTKAYYEYEALPIVLKRARILERVLAEMTIYINDGDLLAGNQAHNLRCPPVYPENFCAWMEDLGEMDVMEKRTVNPLKIPQSIRADLQYMAKVWKGKTLVDRCYATFPDEITLARSSLLFSVSLEKNAVGHCVLDYPKLLAKGYLGIKQEVQDTIAELDLTDPGDLERLEFLRATEIVCDSVIAFSQRYAQLAENLAEDEEDPLRKVELKNLAAICRKVPAYPAETFYEALQSVYFAHTINMIETNAYSMSYGRFDQYMYPYFRQDIDSGVLDERSVQELIDCFWCKTNEVMHVDDSEMVYFHGGHPFGQHLTIGGVTKDDMDAVNELSYMCLDAHQNVGLYQPDFSVRFHKNIDYDFRVRTAEVIRLGLGLPQIFNDEVVIDSLVNDGLPLEEARDYTPTGCVEYATPKCWIRAPGGWLNVPKILELTLNEGRCAITGNQISHRSKPVEEIVSYDDFFTLFLGHFENAVRMHVIWSNLIDRVHVTTMPQPSVSILTDDCIRNGRDAVAGGARYNFTSPLLVGIANVADSLAIIKRMVFEQGSVTLPELRDATNCDFEGYEVLHARLKSFPERYGNDIDFVDQIAREISVLFCDEFEKYRNTRGGKFRAGFWSVTANFNLGANTAATPDGRKAFTPLSDSIAPNEGKDISGLTASFRSASKLDQHRASSGTVLNRHISPKDMEGADKLNKFLDLVDGYFELGGTNLGFNIISTDTLRDAQENPEQYSDLMVKVAGYAAFFTELGKPCQDALIARTEHSL